MSESGLLDPGERLLWTGKPHPFWYALKKGTGAFLFGTMFFSISLFAAIGAINAAITNTGPGNFAVFFVAPFVVVGACLVLSPIWHFVRGMQTTYLLTNSRAITSASGFLPRHISVPLGRIGFVDLRPRRNGFGDIYFKETVDSGGEGGQTIRRDGFLAIPDVARVEQRLRKAIDQLADARAHRITT